MKLITTIKEEKKVEFTEEQVESVYSGKPHVCMCGCAGTYYYSSKNREYASKDRGYKVTDDEVNDKMVKKILKLFEEFSGTIENIDNHIFTIITPSYRQYTICLVKEKVN
ncbi:hypothetical protein A3K72_01665 [Candidatus Woesearchaeota archaeon RBG_13_36_6]|nr:MAG: hypothetical protein A3K72_01665 [Candidatus Woesearchaeota archaeon RBG_13_36_6]